MNADESRHPALFIIRTVVQYHTRGFRTRLSVPAATDDEPHIGEKNQAGDVMESIESPERGLDARAKPDDLAVRISRNDDFFVPSEIDQTRKKSTAH